MPRRRSHSNDRPASGERTGLPAVAKTIRTFGRPLPALGARIGDRIIVTENDRILLVRDITPDELAEAADGAGGLHVC